MNTRRARNKRKSEGEKPPIVDVIEKYFDRAIPDPGHGHVKISCVFHSDDNPSMSLNVDKQYAHCFSCQWAGDSFALIMEVENTDFNGALAAAEEHFGYSGTQGRRSSAGQPAARRVSILDRGTGDQPGNAGEVPHRPGPRRRPRLR